MPFREACTGGMIHQMVDTDKRVVMPQIAQQPLALWRRGGKAFLLRLTHTNRNKMPFAILLIGDHGIAGIGHLHGNGGDAVHQGVAHPLSGQCNNGIRQLLLALQHRFLMLARSLNTIQHFIEVVG